MPEANEDFSACSLGSRQGGGVRICLKVDPKEVGSKKGCWIHGPTTEYTTSTIHEEKLTNKVIFDGT